MEYCGVFVPQYIKYQTEFRDDSELEVEAGQGGCHDALAAGSYFFWNSLTYSILI